MRFSSTPVRSLAGLIAAAVVSIGTTAQAHATISPTVDANAVAAAATNEQSQGFITGASFSVAPPGGNYAAVSDTALALFPLTGPAYGMLSTGDATDAARANTANSTGTANGGAGGGHGASANDLVTLRVDLQVPADLNCLTADFRFMTEEFPEFIGSQYNDAFLVELDGSDFEISNDGQVEAPKNFAFDPDGREVTVNASGTSAEHALGSTYDGATPILRASTPITSGPHSVFLTIYDANDAIYDSTVLFDNLRLRQADPSNCTRGSAPNEDADKRCLDEKPTVIASGGVATGTEGDDVIQGSDADDVIRGKGGNDLICAGPGDDKVAGQAGDDRIQGNSGKDQLKGNAGIDRLDGNRGDDVVSGQNGGDRVKGGAGDDRLFGGAGDDALLGGQGDDFLSGRVGDDRLSGGRDDDTLRGGKGEDLCKGDSDDNNSPDC